MKRIIENIAAIILGLVLFVGAYLSLPDGADTNALHIILRTVGFSAGAYLMIYGIGRTLISRFEK